MNKINIRKDFRYWMNLYNKIYFLNQYSRISVVALLFATYFNILGKNLFKHLPPLLLQTSPWWPSRWARVSTLTTSRRGTMSTSSATSMPTRTFSESCGTKTWVRSKHCCAVRHVAQKTWVRSQHCRAVRHVVQKREWEANTVLQILNTTHLLNS